MKHEQPPDPPATPPDGRDVLIGEIIDQLYHLRKRVRALERSYMIMFAALVLLSLGDLLRLVAEWW